MEFTADNVEMVK